MKNKNLKKGKHLSYNTLTGETYLDNYNIDFLRYFKFSNFIMALTGSLLGFIFWTNATGLFEWSIALDINRLYLIVILGGLLWFIFTTIISYGAVNSIPKATRIAGRRGLFTFSIMLLVLVIGLLATKRIGLNQTFYLFLKHTMAGLFVESIFAVSLDYGISFLEGVQGKKKEYSQKL